VPSQKLVNNKFLSISENKLKELCSEMLKNILLKENLKLSEILKSKNQHNGDFQPQQLLLLQLQLLMDLTFGD